MGKISSPVAVISVFPASHMNTSQIYEEKRGEARSRRSEPPRLTGLRIRFYPQVPAQRMSINVKKSRSNKIRITLRVVRKKSVWQKIFDIYRTLQNGWHQNFQRFNSNKGEVRTLFERYKAIVDNSNKALVICMVSGPPKTTLLSVYM